MARSPRKLDFTRTNSICPTPEHLLLEYVKRNNTDIIRRLVRSNQDLLSYIYPDLDRPILFIACLEDTVQPQTLQTLIDEGADLYYPSAIDEERQMIHFAASVTNSEKLKVIIDNVQHLQPERINDLATGRNALHVLLIDGEKHDEKELLKCAQLLIEAGIDLNQGDANNMSPILWAAKYGHKKIVAAILDKGVTTVDIDTHISNGKTARELIEEKCLYDKTLPAPSETDDNNNDPTKILFGYLKQSKEIAFVNYDHGKIRQYVDAESSQFDATLLQLCCQEGLYKAAEHLLNYEADPNKTAERNRKKPIEIAAERGFYQIFTLLLEMSCVHIPSQILPYLITKQNQNQTYTMKNEENTIYVSDHKKCYEALMKKLRKNKTLLDINEQDKRSNSPLHYAVRYAEPESIHELLDLGASLASTNSFGIMPVEDIDPDDLEKHLDNCIKFDVDSKYDKEDFAVTFNYRTLLPPQKLALNESMPSYSSDAECVVLFNNQEYTEEMEVISYMSKAVELKHLLKHPVIVSFLFMKWHSIQWLFYTNLLFYSVFVLSLVVYIFTYYGYFSEKEKSNTAIAFMYLSYALLWITYIILVFRELFQMMIACWKNYMKNLENYIELILIIITGGILTYHPLNDDTRRLLSALAILLAAFELVLMLGQHPQLSTNVVMLKAVSYTFFKFLLWYSILIIAFSFSFCILFANNGKPDDQTKTVKSSTGPQPDKEEGDENFENPGNSIFKTIVMMTGEFDASDLHFHTYPIISKLIFVMFVFMIAIVLLNLLTGLAVSDTQMIINDAEVVGHIARAQHIKYVETMLLGSILPEAIMKGFRNLCCCIEVNPRVYNSFRPLARKACIFPEVLNYKLTFYPNKQGQVDYNNPPNRRKSSCWSCTNICLDLETIKRTKNIIRAKQQERFGREKQQSGDKDSYINELEKKIDEMQKEQSDMIQKLNIFINKSN